MSRWFYPCVLSIVLASAPARPAFAGRIHPALLEALSKQPASEAATVLLILERQVDVPALNETLRLQHTTREERHRRVVEALQAVARETQPSLLAELDRRTQQGGVMGYTPYWITNLVAVRATGAAIRDLAARPDVEIVEPGFQASIVDPPVAQETPLRGEATRGIAGGLTAIQAPRVWHELGINGSGAIVAVLDTGVDGNHPALRNRWRGNNGHPWQECWHDVVGSASQFPTDPTSHGTHVMGTMAGLGAATQDSIGIAWGAEWIAANAIDQGIGSEFDHDVIDCLQWFADPDGDPETVDDVPDVVQNAWGISEQFGYQDCDARWWAAIDNCEAAGVVLTWSAGGDGPGPATIRSPADRATTPTNCFSTGSVDAEHYGFPYPVTSFSSRGPSGCDVAPPLKIKPEVVAPGVDIYSSVTGGGYDRWSGTAMSGAHVAGVVALMRSAQPDLDVDTIKEILMLTARDEGPAGQDNSYGWGVIDAYEAVAILLPSSGASTHAVTSDHPLASWPNPFSRVTEIRFRTMLEGPVTLTIHDARGRMVRTILSVRLPAGEHTAIWDARGASGRLLPAGVYFCRLSAEGRESQSRVILMP